MKIPRIQTLNYFVQNAFLTKEFRQMEMLLLEFFCWNLVLPTSAHYIEYYKMAALSPNDTLNGEKVRTWGRERFKKGGGELELGVRNE